MKQPTHMSATSRALFSPCCSIVHCSSIDSNSPRCIDVVGCKSENYKFKIKIFLNALFLYKKKRKTFFFCMCVCVFIVLLLVFFLRLTYIDITAQRQLHGIQVRGFHQRSCSGEAPSLQMAGVIRHFGEHSIHTSQQSAHV